MGAGTAWILAFVLLVPLLSAQEKPAGEAKPQGECNAYRVDNNTNRVYFNDPELYISIPPREERGKLRTGGELGQVFAMKSCDTPDLIVKVKVFTNLEEANPSGQPHAEIVSGQPVLILEQRSGWYRVKGRAANLDAPVLWSGEGWVKTDNKTIIVKY